jgi:tripartite-type tricarboxylate transporter receptor subunit TctC
MIRFRMIGWAMCLLAACPVWAQAQAWPAKAARMVVPWAPGGSTDVLARILAQKMSETWSQPFLVENRPGASGNIGSDAVAKAAPDGYTILVGSMSTHAMNGALYAKMPFRPVDDFTPVAILAYVTNVLVAHPSVPANNVKELIALAKSRPGQVSYASAGPGSTNHLSAALFTKMASIDMLHVPYKGGAPAVTDTVSGQVNIFFTGSTNVIEHVKSGRLKLLAVTESRRAKILQNVPTVAETMPGYEMAVWYGMFLPAGAPAEIVSKLNAEANRILALPDVNARLLALGAEPVAKTPQEFARILHDDEAKWGRIIQEIGAKAD